MPDHNLTKRSVPQFGSDKSGITRITSDDMSPMGLYRTSSFTERRSVNKTSDSDTHSLVANPLPYVSSFRPTKATSHDTTLAETPKPETPVRQTPFDGCNSVVTSPSVQTTAWMEPFQLVDDERLVFLNRHGEEWKNHALCLYCFRRHQTFHRLLKDGCEVCGRQEVLESHYWETPERV